MEPQDRNIEVSFSAKVSFNIVHPVFCHARPAIPSRRSSRPTHWGMTGTIAVSRLRAEQLYWEIRNGKAIFVEPGCLAGGGVKY